MENKDEIGNRISELMFNLRLNQSGLANAIGVSHTTVRNVIMGLSKPRFEFIDSICKVYPNISKDWLLTGNGKMYIEEEIPNSSPPALWSELKEQYEKRIKDLEFIVYLYKQEKGVVNFLEPTISRTGVPLKWVRVKKPIFLEGQEL